VDLILSAVMRGLDPRIPVDSAQRCVIIGMAGTSPAMTITRLIYVIDGHA